MTWKSKRLTRFIFRQKMSTHRRQFPMRTNQTVIIMRITRLLRDREKIIEEREEGKKTKGNGGGRGGL